MLNTSYLPGKTKKQDKKLSNNNNNKKEQAHTE